MPKRKKSALEKFFSFKRHRRRFGAKDALGTLVDFDSMKRNLIKAKSQKYTHGSENDLLRHLKNLESEFNEEPELLYYHAKLNVLLRREVRVIDTFERFKTLWGKERKFLLKHLNTRWLIAAADSFVDHDDDPTARSQAFCAISLVNTCKIYETERFATNNHINTYDDQKLKILQRNVALFDGTSAFAVGTMTLYEICDGAWIPYQWLARVV